METPIIENGIVIAQAGTGTNLIGRFDIVVNTDSNSIESFIWKAMPINDKLCPQDDQLEAVINKYKTITDRKYTRVITRFNTVLTHPQRNKETSLGNLFADIFKESLGIDIMLLGSGSIRRNSLGPIVEYSDLTEALPFDDGIYMLKMSGEQLRKTVKYLLRDDAFLGITEFYQFSKGLRIVYSKSRKELDSFTFNGTMIKDSDIFTVGIQNFHFKNITAFFGISHEEARKLQKPRMISTSCFDILEEYLTEHQSIQSKVEGRITIVE